MWAENDDLRNQALRRVPRGRSPPPSRCWLCSGSSGRPMGGWRWRCSSSPSYSWVDAGSEAALPGQVTRARPGASRNPLSRESGGVRRSCGVRRRAAEISTGVPGAPASGRCLSRDHPSPTDDRFGRHKNTNGRLFARRPRGHAPRAPGAKDPREGRLRGGRMHRREFRAVGSRPPVIGSDEPVDTPANRGRAVRRATASHDAGVRAQAVALSPRLLEIAVRLRRGPG